MSSVSTLGEVPRMTCLLPPTPEGSGFTTPTAKLQIWLWVGLALMIIALLGGLMSLLYQQAEQRATSDVHNLSLTLEARLNATLHDAQTALQGIALRMDDDFLQGEDGADIQPWQLHALLRRFPLIGHFDVLTVDGRFLFDSDIQSHPVDQDLQRFRNMLRYQVIGETSPMSMILGIDNARTSLYMAVPIFDRQQRHIGWIAAKQSLKAMLDFINLMDVGPHGVITLRRSDRPEAILRVPQMGDPAQTFQADTIDRLLAEGAQEGSLVVHSRVDGIQRLYGFKRVGDFPLVLVIGLASEDYLMGWKYTLLGAIALCGALYLLIIGLTLRLQANRLRRLQVVDELRQNAFHDALTGLPNRRYLLERVNQAINDCGRGQRLALLYLDVDNFKIINDSLGHVVGDAILKRLAERLLTLKPAVDTVARLSGDEFLVLVDDDDETRLAHLVEQILKVMQAPQELAGYPLSISASAGIALHPAQSQDFGSLLKAADTALTQAKRNGRNTWVFYQAWMGERELRLLQIQTDLRQAFDQNELEIHYQPQIDLGSGAVVGAEALLRWNHPDQGPIAPGEFIPVAESCGLIIPISRWLLGEVCHQAVAWQAAGFGELTVAMNCSAVQFRQGNLTQEVKQALHDSGLKPELLELELTESILIESSERVIETIQGLKALGVRMSIDDFGTGYSSMAYLKRFSVDKLKIDQSFVRGMLTNSQDAAIVQAVITLGHSFDMKVIAEGVESLDILDALILHDCDEAQGYYYAKAISPAALETFMQERLEASFAAENWI